MNMTPVPLDAVAPVTLPLMVIPEAVSKLGTTIDAPYVARGKLLCSVAFPPGPVYRQRGC